MSITNLSLSASLIALITLSCGILKTSPRQPQVTTFTAENNSDFPLVVLTEVSQASEADECDAHDKQTTTTIQPKSKGSGEARMLCHTTARHRISYSVNNRSGESKTSSINLVCDNSGCIEKN
jgi:hypothetical protein